MEQLSCSEIFECSSKFGRNLILKTRGISVILQSQVGSPFLPLFGTVRAHAARRRRAFSGRAATSPAEHLPPPSSLPRVGLPLLALAL
jgi:hypothetical protein